MTDWTNVNRLLGVESGPHFGEIKERKGEMEVGNFRRHAGGVFSHPRSGLHGDEFNLKPPLKRWQHDPETTTVVQR